MPNNDEELYLNSNAMAVSDLTINVAPKTEQRYFEG
jgi:hypothetical protein